LLSAKQIAPGQNGEIEISIKTEGQTALHKSVNVASNDPRQPQIQLEITAQVEPEFIISERSIYFGSVPRGKGAVKEVEITTPPGKQLKLLSADSTDPAVTVKLDPVANSGGKKYKVTATQKADAKDGYHFGMVTIKTTSPLTQVLNIPIRGMVIPPPASPQP
jgi:hypothetical protein